MDNLEEDLVAIYFHEKNRKPPGTFLSIGSFADFNLLQLRLNNLLCECSTTGPIGGNFSLRLDSP
jgi:hypothetical protein